MESRLKRQLRAWGLPGSREKLERELAPRAGRGVSELVGQPAICNASILSPGTVQFQLLHL